MTVIIAYQYFSGPLLGIISSYVGWNAVLLLQLILSLWAGIAVYKAHSIETHMQQNRNKSNEKTLFKPQAVNQSSC